MIWMHFYADFFFKEYKCCLKWHCVQEVSKSRAMRGKTNKRLRNLINYIFCLIYILLFIIIDILYFMNICS